MLKGQARKSGTLLEGTLLPGLKGQRGLRESGSLWGLSRGKDWVLVLGGILCAALCFLHFSSSCTQ